MSRSFFDAVRKFLEVLVGMSGRVHLENREDWMGTPESDRERCIRALDAVRSVWDQEPQDLAKLEEMVTRCLAQYAQGELDAGDYAVRDIDEFLSGVKEKAARRETE